jgi:hypothetical protein
MEEAASNSTVSMTRARSKRKMCGGLEEALIRECSNGNTSLELREKW